ncbi:MAG: HAD-IIA family hydrolase [Halarcobacter sp.]
MSKAFFIDVQGTLIDDASKEPIKGACEFIDFLNDTNTPYVVITNNTKHESDTFKEDLKNKGFNIKNYIDPFFILEDELKAKKLAAFGQDSFLKIIKKLGYEIDFDTPEALVVSVKKEYTNEDYAQMIEAALKCNELIGMHETSTYNKDGKRYPGVGAIMNMIKYAVNKDYKVVGKPSLNFFENAKGLINVDFKDITIISDDMIGDLLGAQKFNMKTCLVLSGKVKSEKEVENSLNQDEKPNFICKDMSEVLKLLKEDKI